MLPILARESVRAASSDCSLLSSRESSALLPSAWRDDRAHNIIEGTDHERYTHKILISKH